MIPHSFDAFAGALPFRLSDYQQAALQALDAPGVSVLVVAPTGSGKSVIADAAIWQARQMEGGAVYTSPLRALANQRFAQLVERWGGDVGLVTGDVAIRPAAPVRVMTAEVYRTIALLPDERPALGATPAAPGRAGRLAWAIFDEAHYLSDPERGRAWEEAILATPRETRLLCLSATIGAPERLAGWLRWLGREVALIHSTERPVPLRHYLFLRGDLHLVLDERGARQGRFPFAGGWALAQRRPNPLRGGAGPLRRRREAPLAGLPSLPPEEWIRQEAIQALGALRARDLVPAIAFVNARHETERLAEAARAAFPEAAGGVAYHHAGLPPAERRRIEQRLRSGDLWLVCGTTTLAAGIDVPARSVLVTGFGRFDGRAFALFSPAEYRQLAGRAGRLGKDEAGAAVLLPSPWHNFEEAFARLTAPLPAVASAFRPAYATALAWWSAPLADRPEDEAAARERRLALLLARTFSAYLRRLRGTLPPPPLTAPDDASLHLAGVSAARRRAGAPLAPPDDASLHQARALGRLLVLDGLIEVDGGLTRRGRFVLHLGGGTEGRLLLRLVEEGAFDALDEQRREDLLATLAEGPALAPRAAPGDDGASAGVWHAYRGAVAAQVETERRAGALLTEPAPAAPSTRATSDAWRRRQAAADLLDRALRAAARSGLALSLASWGPSLLTRLERE